MDNLRFSDLKEKFELLLSCCTQLEGTGRAGSITPEEKADIRDWVTRLSQPSFQVIFIGTFNAGKSTIIDAFFGRLLLPEANQSLTAKATLVHKNQGDTERFVLNMNDGTKKAFEDMALLKEHVTKNEKEDTIGSVEVFINDSPFNNDIVLVDTPGFDVALQKHKDITDAFLAKAHACVVCFDVGLIGSADQADLIDYLSTKKALTSDRRFWVINKWDRQGTLGQAQALESFGKLLQRNDMKDPPSRLFKVAAGTYLAGKLSQKTSRTREEDNFINGIDLQKNPVTQDTVSSFEKLRNDVINFVNLEAKEGFYAEGLRVFLGLSKKIQADISEVFKDNEDEGKIIEREKRKILIEEGEKYFTLITTALDKYKHDFQQIEFKNDFWNASHSRDIRNKVAVNVKNVLSVAKIDHPFISHLLINPHAICGELAEIISPDIIFNIIREHARAVVFDFFPQAAVNEVIKILGDSLPAETHKKMEEATAVELLNFRIKGLVDACFYNHTEALFQVMEPLIKDINPQNAIAPEKYINGFEPIIIQYLQAQVEQVIGKRITVLFHNYFADIILEMEKLLKENKSLIVSNISDDKLEMNRKVQQFLKERNVLNNVKGVMDRIVA